MPVDVDGAAVLDADSCRLSVPVDRDNDPQGDARARRQQHQAQGRRHQLPTPPEGQGGGLGLRRSGGAVAGRGRAGGFALGSRRLRLRRTHHKPRQVALGAKRLQRLGHFLRRGKPLVRLLGQHPIQHRGQLVGNVCVGLANRRHRLLHVGRHLLERASVVRPAKRRAAREQLIERAAEAVDVGPNVDRTAVGGLLGGHVIGRPHGLARARHLLPARLLAMKSGQAQVQHLQLSLGREHQVRRLHVAVDQPVFVGVLQPQGGLAGQLAGVTDRERPAAADQLCQVQPLDVLHDQHRLALDLPGVVRADDVGMVQPADGLHLPFKSCYRLIVVRAALGQHL